MTEFGAAMRMATLGTQLNGFARARRWRANGHGLAPLVFCSDDADRSVLMRVHGTTLDVGCGPGRLTDALTARGHAVLGIDVTPDVVSLTRAAGGVALHRSVFTHTPGEGCWDTVLLIDGTVRAGAATRSHCCAGSRNCSHPRGVRSSRSNHRRRSAMSVPHRIRRADGVVTSWFPWARVPVGNDWVASRAQPAS